MERRVDDAVNVGLLQPFIIEEFYLAIFHMHPDKAPNPDGLNPAFYQHFWDVCGSDVFNFGC